jgi:hypothetical protein
MHIHGIVHDPFKENGDYHTIQNKSGRLLPFVDTLNTIGSIGLKALLVCEIV